MPQGQEFSWWAAMNGKEFVAAALARGFEVREVTSSAVMISRDGTSYRFSILMVEQTPDDKVLALLDDPGDRIAALENISRRHVATDEERAEWRYQPPSR